MQKKKHFCIALPPRSFLVFLTLFSIIFEHFEVLFLVLRLELFVFFGQAHGPLRWQWRCVGATRRERQRTAAAIAVARGVATVPPAACRRRRRRGARRRGGARQWRAARILRRVRQPITHLKLFEKWFRKRLKETFSLSHNR